MEALGLCEKIYGFIAQPQQGPGQETQLGTSSSAVPEQCLHRANEPARTLQIASPLSSDASAVTTCSTRPHQIQSADEGKGVLLGLVGEKVSCCIRTQGHWVRYSCRSSAHVIPWQYSCRPSTAN